MPIDHAMRAVQLAAENEMSLILGGGEPTMYKHLWRVIQHVIRWYGIDDLLTIHPVTIITNGKRKQDAMSLAALAQMGIISVELSQDEWHEPIDQEVIDAFHDRVFSAVIPSQIKEALQIEECEKMTSAQLREYWIDCMSLSDLRGIRTVKTPMNHGRAKKIPGASDGCCCDELFVSADGSVWQCGCKKRKLQAQMTYNFIDDIEGEFVPGWCSEHEDFGEELSRVHELSEV